MNVHSVTRYGLLLIVYPSASVCWKYQPKTDDSDDVMKQLERDCRQNNLSRALLCMQKAKLMNNWFEDDTFPKNCVEACPFSL